MGRTRRRPAEDDAGAGRGLTRRDALGTVAGAAALALTASLGRLAWAQQAPVDVTSLRGGLELVRGPGASIVVAAFGGTVLATDGGAPAMTGLLAILDGIFPGARERIVFNTNWRPEHTGTNALLRAAGARILAHENTKLWMTNDFTVAWEGKHYVPQPPDALPNDTFYTGGALDLDGGTVEYEYAGRAHTDGDVFIRFPAHNILVVSDLLAVDAFPCIDWCTGGWIGGMLEATERLLELADADTLIVPAAGPPQRRGALERQLELLAETLEVVGDAYSNAHSIDELLAAQPLAAYVAERGDPELFLRQAYKSAWGHIRDLGISIV